MEKTQFYQRLAVIENARKEQLERQLAQVQEQLNTVNSVIEYAQKNIPEFVKPNPQENVQP